MTILVSNVMADSPDYDYLRHGYIEVVIGSTPVALASWERCFLTVAAGHYFSKCRPKSIMDIRF